MSAVIAWDQTLVSFLLAAGVAGVAYWRAARVLRRQELLRGLRSRQEALQQVLLAFEGDAAEYLANEELDYPQREMVELERSALQAQIFYVRDLEMQTALRDICYPSRHQEALAKLRAALESVEAEIAALRA